jgi:hypothetical protein
LGGDLITTEPFTSFLNWELSVWPHLSQATPICTWKLVGDAARDMGICERRSNWKGFYCRIRCQKQFSQVALSSIWTVGIGLVATIVAASYVSCLAKVCCFSFCLSGFGSVLFLKQEQRQNCHFLDWWLPVPPCVQFAVVFAQILKEHSLSCRMQLKRLSEDWMTNKSNQESNKI